MKVCNCLQVPKRIHTIGSRPWALLGIYLFFSKKQLTHFRAWLYKNITFNLANVIFLKKTQPIHGDCMLWMSQSPSDDAVTSRRMDY